MDQVEDDMGNPMDMFILSQDCLFGKKIDQTIPPNCGWSARPERNSKGATSSGLISPWMGSSNQKAERDALILLLRRGVPPCLRCAVWVTNVHFALAPPDLPKHELDDYGTLKRVEIFEHGWQIALKSIFPDESDEEDAHMIDFGLGDRNIVNLLLTGGPQNTPIPEKGAKALKRVLFAARMSLGIEYCPMLPDITAQLLMVMEEAYAYATLRKMLEDSSHFFALSRVEHVAWCYTFKDLLQKNYPQTYDVMKTIGLLVPGALDPIFKRLFVQLLRPEHVKRIMDLYTLEGIEVIFRFGTALMCLFHAHMTTQAEFNCPDVHAWWGGVKIFAHSRRFRFDVFLEKQVYGVVSGIMMKRSIFPRRRVFQRMVERNEERAEDGEYDLTDDDMTAYVYNDSTLGFVQKDISIVLAKHAAERHALALWLPSSLTSTKLDIIYSSSVHGRTLERFYHHCAASKARYTLTLFEILGKRDIVIGMFATTTWRSNFVGGDGNCFLFRLRPNPRCFKWVNLSHSGKPPPESDLPAEPSLSFDSASSVENSQGYFADQIMVTSSDFISMGIGGDGASGLRVNEDFTKGSSSPAMHGMGTGQESLLGDDSQVFEIGLVECYRFVREVDGGVVK
jgi:hypothetical protein